MRTMQWLEDEPTASDPDAEAMRTLQDENQRLHATVERLQAEAQSLHAALRCAGKVLAPYIRGRG